MSDPSTDFSFCIRPAPDEEKSNPPPKKKPGECIVSLFRNQAPIFNALLFGGNEIDETGKKDNSELDLAKGGGGRVTRIHTFFWVTAATPNSHLHLLPFLWGENPQKLHHFFSICAPPPNSPSPRTGKITPHTYEKKNSRVSGQKLSKCSAISKEGGEMECREGMISRFVWARVLRRCCAAMRNFNLPLGKNITAARRRIFSPSDGIFHPAAFSSHEARDKKKCWLDQRREWNPASKKQDFLTSETDRPLDSHKRYHARAWQGQ